MAPARGAVGTEKKGRKKKNKSRTQIEISSSESESDTPQQSSRKFSKASAVPAKNQQNGDIIMKDTYDASRTSSPTPMKFNTIKNLPEEFSSIYLKKVTAELADDLVKVRDAQDFKASSLPMLVHALRQGSSIYSVEEKKRIVNATG